MKLMLFLSCYVCPLQFQRVRSLGPATSLHALAELLPVGESPIIIARALCRAVRRLFESETPHNSIYCTCPRLWVGYFGLELSRFSVDKTIQLMKRIERHWNTRMVLPISSFLFLSAFGEFSSHFAIASASYTQVKVIRFIEMLHQLPFINAYCSVLIRWNVLHVSEKGLNGGVINKLSASLARCVTLCSGGTTPGFSQRRNGNFFPSLN